MAVDPRTHRRPVRANTELVQATLDRLEGLGASWSPRFVGLDGGDELLTWLPGRCIDDWHNKPDLLIELAGVVRNLHDSTVDLAPGQECLVHDDLQPRNVVVDVQRVGLIDWEQLRPGRRVQDVAQICWSFAIGPLGDDVEPTGRRWSQLLDAYGLIKRDEVVTVALAKIDRCINDIAEAAATGSEHHRLLRDRGDIGELGRVSRWISDHRRQLLDLVT